MNFKIIIPLVAIIIIFLFFVPVESDLYGDIYVKITVSEPITGSAKISDYQVIVKPHTILQIPYLSTASILGSGQLKVFVSTSSASTEKSLGDLWIGGSGTWTMVLPGVPVEDNSVSIKLYENNNQVDEQSVLLQ